MKNIMEFCGNGRCCPVLEVSDDIVAFQDNGVYTHTLSRESFSELVRAAKEGKFDSLIGE